MARPTLIDWPVVRTYTPRQLVQAAASFRDSAARIARFGNADEATVARCNEAAEWLQDLGEKRAAAERLEQELALAEADERLALADYGPDSRELEATKRDADDAYRALRNARLEVEQLEADR